MKKREVCKNCKHCVIVQKGKKSKMQCVWCCKKGVYIIYVQTAKDKDHFNNIQSGNSLPMACFEK